MSKKNEVPARQKEFLETGAAIAAKVGIVNVTRRAIAEHHDVTDPLVGKHVGGKADLQAGIKKTMKRLGLREPAKDVIETQGRALRARKDTGTAKKSSVRATRGAQKVTSGKKVAAKKSTTPATVVKKSAKGSNAGVKSKKPTAALPADPKKGAPSRKVIKKAPSNKFPTKAPPLPALPNLGE